MAADNLQSDAAARQEAVREFFRSFACNMGTTPFNTLHTPDHATMLTASAKAIVWVLARDFQEANTTGLSDLRGEIVGEALSGVGTLLSLAELSAHLAALARHR